MKKYQPRKKTFKTYRQRAIALQLKYEGFIRANGQSDTAPIVRALLSGKISQEDIDNKTEAFYEIIDAMLYDNMPVREMFLLENAKELCDVVYEDCDIEHKEEWEIEEYREYMTFLQETLSFFLLTSKSAGLLKKPIHGLEETSPETQT